MKIILLMVTVLLLAGCCSNGMVVKQYDDAHILPARNLNTLKDIDDLNRYVAYFDKGDTLPLDITIDNEIIGINPKKADFTFKQRVYFMIKIPENLSNNELADLKTRWESNAKISDDEQLEFLKHFMFTISLDAKNWAPINDPNALKQVLNIQHGNISFGLGMDENKGINSKLSIKTEK